MKRPILWVLVAATVTGCVTDFGDEQDDPELATLDSAVLSTNKLSANKLSANKLSANKLGAFALNKVGTIANSLIATLDGREVMSYLASCALDAGTTLSASYGGKTYTFPGAVGLAPAWNTRAPTLSERRWVSACILARTNAYGITVPLSLRGNHPKLGSTLTENLTYKLTEGGFYGDLFDPTGPKQYACVSELRNLDLDVSTQQLRACAISSNGTTTGCGFTYTGKCNVTDLTLAPACTGLLAPYTNCRAGTSSSSPRYAEVITVVLAL